MARKESASFDEIRGMIGLGLRRAVVRPTINSYEPHEKQIKFHSNISKGRLYIGGNRSGKTVGGVTEDIYRLKGEHPFQRVPPPPVNGRVVTVSYIEGIEKIIKPEFQKWIPPSLLINGSWEDSYNKLERTLTLTNDSTCEFMSYDQKLEKFAGTSRHFVHFDEEPPKAIFNECKARLVDTGGPWYITMTPVEGMTWVYDDIYTPGLVPGSNIAIIEIDMAENPYISDAEIEDFLSGLDKDERKARGAGKFVQLGGTVFKHFTPDHVVPATELDLRQIKYGWTHYASMDHGLNAPTVWLWHAVSPKGFIITYDEIYDNELLVKDYAELIHEHNKREGRRAPDIYVGDPAIKQRNAVTGTSIQTEYAKLGVPIVLGNNNIRVGIDKMNTYLKEKQWVITDACPNLAREMKRVRWKTYSSAKQRQENAPRDEINRQHSHSPDSAKYLFSLLPELHIPESRDNSIDIANRTVREIMGAVTTPVGPGIFDLNLSRPPDSNTEWTVVDEHMGGIF
jgi:phage terminase large subunit-like protein